MLNLAMLEKAAYEIRPKNSMPFLAEQASDFDKNKYFRNLKIIHNTPITVEAVCKVIPLLKSGADVTVTVSPGLVVSNEIVALLKQTGVNFILHNEIVDDFDISCDCNGGLSDVVHPRIGAVELTQSGRERYEKIKLTYPVISIDESELKKLETFYGTGDGFLRAFLELTNEVPKDKKFVLFGYGKVGQGIIKALESHTTNIVVVDVDQEKIKQVKNKGLLAIQVTNKKEVIEHLNGALCAVTATGVHSVISRYFNQADFSKCKYLANMGADDEFGKNFEDSCVLFQKQPINFSLKEPTLLRYLDPVFYAHNHVIHLLINEKFPHKFHPLPKNIDMEILNRWANHHNYDLSLLFS